MQEVEATSRESSPVDNPVYAFARAMASPRFAPAIVALVIVYEFFAMLARARAKLFWYDELVTFHVSKLQPFALSLE